MHRHAMQTCTLKKDLRFYGCCVLHVEDMGASEWQPPLTVTLDALGSREPLRRGCCQQQVDGPRREDGEDLQAAEAAARLRPGPRSADAVLGCDLLRYPACLRRGGGLGDVKQGRQGGTEVGARGEAGS